MKKGTIALHLILFIANLYTSCSHTLPPSKTRSYSGPLVISNELLTKYRINESDLVDLQVYLDQELLIKKLRSYPEKQTPEIEHTLNLKETEKYLFVLFEAGTKGQIVGVEQTPSNKLLQLINPVKWRITVMFDPDGKKLNFITTQSTGFELETERAGRYIRLDNSYYQCVYGCGGNSLITEADYFYEFYNIDERVRGNPFPD